MLKYNQVDVLPFFVEASGRSNKETARAFFQEPYALEMRIIAVYELSSVLE